MGLVLVIRQLVWFDFHCQSELLVSLNWFEISNSNFKKVCNKFELNFEFIKFLLVEFNEI
jgi:hypothetical protein